MNCFQIYYLWHWATTMVVENDIFRLLWIAFRFTTFGIEPQRLNLQAETGYCCELLSDLLPLALSHNCQCSRPLPPPVVNCFQIYYLWHWATTYYEEVSGALQLWIAFRFTTFGIEPQPAPVGQKLIDSCELLSDLLPLALSHNMMTEGS